MKDGLLNLESGISASWNPIADDLTAKAKILILVFSAKFQRNFAVL